MESPSEMGGKPQYVKFIVYAFKDPGHGSRTPITGVHLAVEHAQELLEEGYTVQIRPFTREEWANRE